MPNSVSIYRGGSWSGVGNCNPKLLAMCLNVVVEEFDIPRTECLLGTVVVPRPRFLYTIIDWPIPMSKKLL